MLKHKHLIIRANVENPPKDEQAIVEWAKQLINNIGMKIMMGPYAKYCTMQGNRGLTCVTIIETSHIAIHAWDEEQPGLIQLDVYTWGFKQILYLGSMQEFNPIKIDYKYLDRENELITI